MHPKIVSTADGSPTLYLEELDETYHSTHGAIQEAQHVFIKNGFQAVENKPTIRVFEMGLGTGLNAFLTALETSELKQVKYYGIEAYPLGEAIVKQINYPKLLGAECTLFEKIHTCEWDSQQNITSHFSLQKIHKKIENLETDWKVDLIYFDAFGPRAQGEMWQPEILQKMYDLLVPNGCLVTYCAKGQFKRDLKSIGFEVEVLPGPPGKREMTRAVRE